MSLVRLLTAGKSLVGMKDTENRYRMTSQRLLPKFGSAKKSVSRSRKQSRRRRSAAREDRAPKRAPERSAAAPSRAAETGGSPSGAAGSRRLAMRAGAA